MPLVEGNFRKFKYFYCLLYILKSYRIVDFSRILRVTMRKRPRSSVTPVGVESLRIIGIAVVFISQ